MLRKDRKELRFQVQFELGSLTSVPLVNGVVFAKCKLGSGGFMACSERVSIMQHAVAWNQAFEFTTKMTTSACGLLQPRVMRISVRRETKGGRSYEKLGFVDLNLAESAGAGRMERRFLLQGHKEKDLEKGVQKGLDNSILTVRNTFPTGGVGLQKTLQQTVTDWETRSVKGRIALSRDAPLIVAHTQYIISFLLRFPSLFLCLFLSPQLSPFENSSYVTFFFLLFAV